MSVRPTRARFVTVCPDCEELVGVTRDKFNRAEIQSDNAWRSTVHRNKVTNSRCTGARTVVAQPLVWERWSRAEAVQRVS